MDIRKLQRAIVDGLEDVKAQNIVVFDTEKLSSLFERVIIASGTSNRQTKALAASVRDAVKATGLPPPRTEGEENGEWIIVDCGAAVVHVMQAPIREYYNLEEIWGEKPVKLRIASAGTKLVKASVVPAKRAARPPTEPLDAPAAKRPARLPATKRPPARKRASAPSPAAPGVKVAAPTALRAPRKTVSKKS